VFDYLFLVNSVVPQPRVEDAVPSPDLHYVTSGPGLLGDVHWALGCTGLGIQDGHPVCSVSLQPSTYMKSLENRLYKHGREDSTYGVFVVLNYLSNLYM
jgi:hypothetical protein